MPTIFSYIITVCTQEGRLDLRKENKLIFNEQNIKYIMVLNVDAIVILRKDSKLRL